MVCMANTHTVESSSARGISICHYIAICLFKNSDAFLQELQADLQRQQRVRVNVALIEARDLEERRRFIAANTSPEPLPKLAIENPPSQTFPEAPSGEPPLSSPTKSRMGPKKTLPAIPSDSYEPQSWSPRAHDRGGQ